MGDVIYQVKMLLAYAGVLIPSIFLTIAAYILYTRKQAIATGLFLGGSVVATLLHIVNSCSVFYLSQVDDLQRYTQWMGWISLASSLALLVQAVGMMVFAVEMPKNAGENKV